MHSVSTEKIKYKLKGSPLIKVKLKLICILSLNNNYKVKVLIKLEEIWWFFKNKSQIEEIKLLNYLNFYKKNEIYIYYHYLLQRI